jgi:hypothetical protein
MDIKLAVTCKKIGDVGDAANISSGQYNELEIHLRSKNNA